MGFFLSLFFPYLLPRVVSSFHIHSCFLSQTRSLRRCGYVCWQISRRNISDKCIEKRRNGSWIVDCARSLSSYGISSIPIRLLLSNFDSLLFSWIGKIKYLWTILAKDFSFSFSFRTQSNKWFVYFGKFKFQVCVFLSSRKRDLSRKINLNIFNVEEDVKVRYILEFNYTVCIYMYIWICQWVFSMDQKNVGHRSRLIKNEIEIIVKSYVKLQES